MLTLSSDFGSPYPAAMRGVILQKTDARLVDVSHEFPRQDVRSTAFWLREVLPWFPPAVHCVVVDPGVGTDRAALVIRAGDHVLVGPDNGVLRPVARELGGGTEPEVFAIDSDAASTTFHGRDVFAPTAARIHDTDIDQLDTHPDLHPVSSAEDLRFPDPTITDDRIEGTVLVVDGFGNVVSNIPGTVIRDRFGESVSVNGESVPVERTYAAVDPGQRLVTVGSHGNVELAVNRGRGDDAFGVDTGAKVVVEWE